MSVPRKVIGSAMVDLHHDKTTTNDKWLTLAAILKLIYTRFDFDAGIDFTVPELKKAANEVGPLWSKILEGNHTIVRLQTMEMRRKDFDNNAKKNIEREQVALVPPLVESTLHGYSIQPAYTGTGPVAYWYGKLRHTRGCVCTSIAFWFPSSMRYQAGTCSLRYR
jgi:hypothetical protein